MTVPTRRPGPLDRRRFLLGAASVGAPSGSAPPRPPHARPGTGPTPPRGRRRLPGRQPPGALAAAGVTATFMVMGRNAVAPRSLLAEVVAGHEIGSHTWSHLDLGRITPARAREEIVRGKEAVEAVVQRPLVGSRPPRGELTGFALRVCPTTTCGPRWVPAPSSTCTTGWVRGTSSPSTAFTAGLVARREVEVRALPTVLHRIADRGITLIPAGRLLASSDAGAAAAH